MWLQQKGCISKGLSVIIILLAAVAAFLLPRYVGQFEKTRALSMQAMLINVLIAQDAYYAKQGVFTDDWQTLLPNIEKPASLQPQLQAIAGQPQNYFIGFGQNAAKKQNGYIVSLALQEDKQSGTITATRTPNWFYAYQLRRALPVGKLECSGKNKSFCNKIIHAVEEFELENLVPVEKEPEKGA